jgi:hypothetical protein
MTATMREVKLTEAQATLLRAMGETPNALRNYDEGSPKWWIEGGRAARHSVARALIRRRLVVFSGHWGGQPGTLGFTTTPAGRLALAAQEGGEKP